MTSQGTHPPVSSRRDDAGFTLLELLVVVTILVALAAAVGTVALNFLGGARADTARIQMGQIEAGLDLYRLDVGRYPTAAEGLDALLERPAGVDRWGGPYVKGADTLTDPWGAPFRYAVPGESGPFDLLSLGADAAEGGEGEAADVRL
jgi:general secretion pathway protein G